MKTQRTTDKGYNASVIYTDANGKVYCRGAAQVVDGKVHMYAGCWTHNNGTPAFHEDFERASASTLRIGGVGSTREIRMDGTKAYRAAFGS